MSGMKTASGGGGRTVQDGHYFYSKLSEKRSQIMEANERLRKDMEDLQAARPRSLQMMARLEEIISDVKGLEMQFQQYNLVLQKATVHACAADVHSDIAATQARSTVLHTQFMT
jgi:methylthioribose-1-phosphate isomerase